LEKDVDIKYIQAMLGHSSIVTTQIYTHVNRARQRHILKTKHPRKDFTMGVVDRV
jgi:integrase/recombinase XerD